MTNKNSALDLFNAVKTIVDNYLNNRKPAAVLVGSYNGSAILINDRLPLPMSKITGETKDKLAAGDKVRLLRNDGGKEYFILEIIGRRYVLAEELEALRREVT